LDWGRRSGTVRSVELCPGATFEAPHGRPMQLILPDVLATARGLSAGAAGFIVLVGFLMWAAGWRWHRFWVVFGLTLAAGVVGLGAGSAAGGGQVMVVGVLLAVAAGMLALELSKILAFVTGGVAAWVAT